MNTLFVYSEKDEKCYLRAATHHTGRGQDGRDFVRGFSDMALPVDRDVPPPPTTDMSPRFELGGIFEALERFSIRVDAVEGRETMPYQRTMNITSLKQ